MATSTTVLFITVLVSICHQIAGQHNPFPTPGRYIDRDVTYYFNLLCKRTRCGFEQVCERKVNPCLVAPCYPMPDCVQTPGGSMKQGSCPSRTSIIPRPGRPIECNTDYGCRRISDICCHGVGISRCMRPRRSGPRPRRRY